MKGWPGSGKGKREGFFSRRKRRESLLRGKEVPLREKEDPFKGQRNQGCLTPFEKGMNGLRAAFAMFSVLPVKNVDWEEENLSYMLLFFPLVGHVIALGFLFIALLGKGLGFQTLFLSIALTLLPIVITGGIHLDGLIDTEDALSSWQSRQRRLEILKDSHVGAFGVIRCCCFFLGELAAFSQLLDSSRGLMLMGLCFAASRCLSAMMVVTLPKAKQEGTVAAFSRGSVKKVILLGNSLHLGLLFLVGLRIAFVPALLLCAFSYLFARWFQRMALHSFGGITGDLNGYFVCYYELGQALVLAVASQVFPFFF